MKSNELEKSAPVQSIVEPWTPEEEVALTRKVDKRVLCFLAVTFLFAFLARANIGNAKILNKETNDTLLNSLNMDLSQFALSISLFFIPYIPSNMVLKSSRPSIYMAIICGVWGVVAVGSAFLTDFTGFAVTRAILGVAESGFVPGSVYYLSMWYKPKEQGLRYVLFFSSATIAGMLGGCTIIKPQQLLIVLATAISQLNNLAGLKGWQWLFIIEGLPSVFLAVMCLKYLPDSPSTAYFFTEKEKYIATHRIVVKADTSTFDLRECLVGLFHPRTLAFGLMGFCTTTPMYSFSFLMPTLVSNLGYESLTAQLLSSPPFFFGYFFSILFAWHSDKTERKFHLSMVFGGFMTCFFLMNVLTGMVKYAVINVCVCLAISGLPVLLAWHNEVLGPASKTTRAATSGMVISITNMSGIVAPMIYKEEWFGNAVNGSLGGVAILCVLFITVYIKYFKAAPVVERVSEEVA